MHLFAPATSGTLDNNTLPNGITAWIGFTSQGGLIAGN
jgi:hypothetical protein